MRGKIVSDQDGRVEVSDHWGKIRVLWRKPGGFYLGENGRLYTTRGRDGHRGDEDIEFISLGRAASTDMETHHVEKSQRSVKDAMAGDHLRYLYKHQKTTLEQIGQRYGASRQYILKLLREYDIAGRPPGNRPHALRKEHAQQVMLQRIAQALLDGPETTDECIAGDLSADPKVVQGVRRELQEKGHIL